MKQLSLIILSISFLFALIKELHSDKEQLKQDSIKSEAFRILQVKCNVCHATKKKTEIFTYQNMDSLAEEINRQVFIKKKMPKGRKIKLTPEDEQQLKTWIASLAK